MDELANRFFHGTSDADGRFSESASDYIKFATVVLGAVTMGWAILLLLNTLQALRSGSRASRYTAVTSITIWFVVDSAFSIYAEFAENAALNVPFFAIFAILLAAMVKHLQNQPA